MIRQPFLRFVLMGLTGLITANNGGAQIVTPVYGGGYGEVGTAAGDILESQGDLIRDQGQAMLFRSLSAKEYQAAIDRALDNRREQIESYYKMREVHDEYVKEQRIPMTQERANRLAQRAAPQRMPETLLDPDSGKIRWPPPLDADALKPYRRPIEETFAKRSSLGEQYDQFDHLQVRRMVNLMQEAIDLIEGGFTAREKVALDEYLDRISFESKFNSDGLRVDMSETQTTNAQLPGQSIENREAVNSQP